MKNWWICKDQLKDLKEKPDEHLSEFKNSLTEEKDARWSKKAIKAKLYESLITFKMLLIKSYWNKVGENSRNGRI